MHRQPHERLRDLRIERGFFSQADFCVYARRQGHRINKRRYGEIERGEVKPRIDEIIAISQAMGISPELWLIGISNYPEMDILTDKEKAVVRQLITGLIELRA